jgi:hypothetical protein
MTESEEESLHKDILNKEVNKLIANECLFLNMNWIIDQN